VCSSDLAATPDEVRVPLDPQNWEIITDAMAAVVNPGGTAGLSHLQGIDFAGKTGSAQTISNALKAKMGAAGKKFKDNGWFAGVEPRRNPDIVVCALLEEGEHGYLAARTAALVIKAYVDKQRQQPTKVAGSKNGKVEIGAVWGEPGVDEHGDSHLQAGRFFVDLAHKRAPLAVAAPGMQ